LTVDVLPAARAIVTGEAAIEVRAAAVATVSARRESTGGK